jgi:hypothetical protein
MVPVRAFCVAAFVACLSPAPSFAAAITGIGITNTSDALELVANGNNLVREFRTATGPIGAVTQTGSTLEFTSQFQWMQAFRIDPDTETSQSPNFALIMPRHVSYELEFTIEDPTGAGYSLDIGSMARGVVVAALHPTEPLDGSAGPTNAPQVLTSGSAFNGRLDTGSGFGGVEPGLHTSGGAVLANEANPFVSVLADSVSSLSAGTFFGTQTFRIEYSTRPSPNTSTAFNNFTRGESDILYGLATQHASGGDPTRPDFEYAGYPGPGGETASGLGHFVTVSVTFNDAPAAVPAPSAAAGFILGFGLLALAARRRRG